MYIVITIVTVANSYTNLIPVVELQLNNAIKLTTCLITGRKITGN